METAQKKPSGNCYSTKEKMGNQWESSANRETKKIWEKPKL